MKKFNYLILAGLSLVAAISCNKQLTPTDEPEAKAGIPMTLTATIGGPETKLGYTDESNVLKGQWNANESISVITLDDSKCVVTIDTFTTGSESEGSKTADFKGTLSAGATSDIRVLYPAVSKYDDKNYGTSLKEGSTASRLIDGIQIGNSWATFDETYMTQPASGSTAHLGNATILEGIGAVSGSVLTVDLKPLNAVMRLDITLPSDAVGKALKAMVLTASNSSGYYEFHKYNWFYYFEGKNRTANSQQINIYLGSRSGGTHEQMTIASTKLVVYIPFVPGEGVVLGPSGGSELRLNCQSDFGFTGTKNITLSNDTALEPGKLYRLNVDFTTP